MAESNRDPQATARRALPRNRASSLRQLAATLPSVDRALDELIARANQTELDVGAWNTAATLDPTTHGPGLPGAGPPDAEALGAEPLEPDALGAEGLVAEAVDVGRLETELRDAGTREQALRHQLDTLQGRLATAEARTAAAAPRAATARSWPWLAAGGAFLGGLALMFAVTRLTGPAEPSASAQARDPAVMPGPVVTPIQVPTVTPIDPPATAAPPPIDPPATASPTVAPPPVDPPATASPAGPGASRNLVAKPRDRPPAPPAAPAHASSPRGELADPFAEPGKPGDRPAPRDRRAPGPIVDPF